MIKFNFHTLTLDLTLSSLKNKKLTNSIQKITPYLLLLVFILISALSFYFYYQNSLGLAYNDARSHLDIGRRVVEGLKPGIAQLGSVWLPLPHILMIPTIWNDFMWHTGLSGAIISMLSFVGTGIIIFYFLKELGVSLLARVLGVFVFAANINVLYLQSTAMTELLLLFTMTSAVYFLTVWTKRANIIDLILSAFFVMLATLVRYDGWFLFLFIIGIVFINSLKKGYKTAEGLVFFYITLAGLGIILWLAWNQLIFNDAFYFAFGPYSAHAQQQQLDQAGILATKGNIPLSIKVYFYALGYNSGLLHVLLGIAGAIVLWMDKSLTKSIRFASTALFAPLAFNIIALYLGHSVLFVQGISGDTWFNVRYGIMMMPSIAILVAYLFYKVRLLRAVIVGSLLLVTFFAFINNDAVTIDDARVGSSQKNVSEVSGWLASHAKDTPGFVLISVASHDAIIFSSGLPMAKFIHEGTGTYWTAATTSPDRWARWIIMRTNDDNDLTFRSIKKTVGFKKYNKVASYPFADIYEIKPEFVSQLETKPVLPKQR